MIEVRRECKNIFKVLKEKCQPIILYSVKNILQTESQGKNVPEQTKKMSEFIIGRPKQK